VTERWRQLGLDRAADEHGDAVVATEEVGVGGPTPAVSAGERAVRRRAVRRRRRATRAARAWRVITHMARTPSFQPIFLPSSYERPRYETPTSKMRQPSAATLAVSSGSTPNRSSSIVIRSRTSRRKTL
jgi:hypothetical protein